MSRFHVGDIVLVRSLPEIKPEYRGLECTVLSPPERVRGFRGRRHVLEVAGFPSRRVLGRPCQLKPLPPPDLPGAWGECVFKPEGVNAN